MAERIKQPLVFNFIVRSVLLEHPGRLRILLCATGLCCVTLGEVWEVRVVWNCSTVQRWVFTQSPLGSSGSDQDREGTCWSLQAQEQPGSCWYNPDLLALSQHRGSCPAPECSTGRRSRLVRLLSTVIKVWKGLENRSKVEVRNCNIP